MTLGWRLFVLPQERIREFGWCPARIGCTIGIAGLHRVRNTLHLITKALQVSYILS